MVKAIIQLAHGISIGCNQITLGLRVTELYSQWNIRSLSLRLLRLLIIRLKLEPLIIKLEIQLLHPLIMSEVSFMIDILEVGC